MISIEQQNNLFMSISKRMKRKITAYAIGGTAMMFHGLKDATLDIDLVFMSHSDRTVFEEAAVSLGYVKMDSIDVYGDRSNKPEMVKLGESRLDLFLPKVMNTIFSEEMVKRAANSHAFSDKLTIKIADPGDILIMKCATERIKDRDDVKRMSEITSLNWDAIVSEAKNQIALGNSVMAMELGCFLEEMNNKLGMDVPKKVLDELFGVVEKQSREKRKKA